MRRLEVRLDWGDADPRTVGTLADLERRTLFEFDPAFLREPLPLSPFKLPVRPGVHEDAERTFAGLFGVFDDSLPDGWGRLLMDRAFERAGVRRDEVTPLDRLAYLHTRAMGALTYHPPADVAEANDAPLDLTTLAQHAERIAAGSAEDVLPALHRVGGSPGGARPKVLLWVGPGDHLVAGTDEAPTGYVPYLVKFGARDDEPVMGRVEAAYARMARDAGMDVPATRTFTTSDGVVYFATRRFDRRGDARLHMHTLGGLLHASHRVPSAGYEAFLRATRALTRDETMVIEAYRRMAFNVLAHNRDDHVKNQSFLMDAVGEWRLAPAYDLVPSTGINGWHSMDVAGEARTPGVDDMLRLAAATAVDEGYARAAIERVRDAVRAWPRHADAEGVPRAETERIATLHRFAAV